MSLLDKASLVQIPSGYKATKLYSVVPESGVGDLSFARSSTATRVNESGIIETIAIDTPRLDYLGGGCPKLLIEPQSTNSLIYSEQFDNSYWGKTGVSIIANDTIAPDGTMTADRATNLFTGQKNIQKSITVGAGSFSVYAKKGVGDTFNLLTLGPTVSSTFDLQNGTASGVGVIQEIGSGWYRCSIPITGTTQVRIYPPPILNDYVYLWGVQLEGVTAATSYIPTSGTTATRTQDTSVTTGLSSLIGQVGGVLYFNAAAQNNSINGRISIGDGSFDNRVMVSYTSTPNQIRVQIASGGSNVFSQNYTLTNATDFNKIAVKWNLNDFSVWVNSIEVLTGNSGNIPLGMDTLSFNRSGSNSRYFYGEVKELAVFFTALTDTELAALTTI